MLGFPPNNNGVNKGCCLVGGVEGWVLEGGSKMVGTTCDMDLNINVWVRKMFS
jgi:hypothetical protein